MTDVWLGLIHVESVEDDTPLSQYPGAYVNVMVLGESLIAAQCLLIDKLETLNLFLLGQPDLQSYTDRENESNLSLEMVHFSKKLSSENPIWFDEFQAYEDY